MGPRRQTSKGAAAAALPAIADGTVADAVSKYADTNPDEVVVCVNEAHMVEVNNALDIVRETFPGDAAKDSATSSQVCV